MKARRERVRIQTGERFQQDQRHVLADHGGALEQPAVLVRQPVDPVEEDLLHRDRHRARRGRILDHRPRQLLEEEGVALRTALDERDEGLRHLVPSQGRLQHGAAGLARQGLEGDRQRGSPRRPGRRMARPVGRHQEQRCGGQGAGQPAQELLGIPIAPVEILDRHRERPLPARRDQELSHRLGDAGLDGQRRERRRLGAGPRAEHGERERHPLLRIEPERADAAADLVHQHLRGVAIADVAELADHVGERHVRDGPAVGHAAALEIAPSLALGVTAKLEQQPRLPDPGLSRDSHRLAPARGGGRGALAQHAQLLAASGERRLLAARPGAGALAAAETPDRPDAVGRARRYQVEAAIQEARCFRARQDSPRLRGGGEGIEHRQGPALRAEIEGGRGAPELAHQERVDVQAEPDGPRGGRLLARAVQGRLDRPGGQRSATGRVLDGLDPESGDDRVRRVLLDPPAEAGDLVEQHLDRPRRLGRRHRTVLGDGGQRRLERGDAAGLPADGAGGDGRRGRGRAAAPARARRRSGRGGRRREPVLLDPVAQGVRRDAEPRRRVGDVAAGLAERARDLLPLQARHAIAEMGAGLDPRRGRRRGRGRRGELQHLRRHQRSFAQQRDALHDVGQLAHVAGPRVREQGRRRGLVQPLGRHAVIAAGAGEEVLGQGRDVRPALAQRRQPELEHGEPVVERVVEPARAHRRVEVGARRRQDPHVHRLAPRAAQAPHEAVLQHGEELALERRGQQAELVEEERAVVRRLEQAGLCLAGVGEGAALVAEQLGFQQGLGNRRAVDVDERGVAPRARPVDRAGEQALAGSRLPLDEEGRRAGRVRQAGQQAPERLAHGHHPRTLADQPQLLPDTGKGAHRIAHRSRA